MRREYPVAEEKAVTDVIEPNPMLFAFAYMFQVITVYQCRSSLGYPMTNLQMM